MVIFHFIGAFSGTIGKRACNAGADDPTVTKVLYAITAILNFVTIVSGIFVTIVGHKNLGLWIESFSNKEFLDPKDQEEFKAKKHKETQRSFLYPLSTLLTLSTEVVLCIWMIFSMPPPAIYIVNSIMLGFKGILTLFTFLIDPTAQQALKHTYKKLRGTHTGEELELKDI
ncbi:hypothetical protein CONCODRAFT_5272 [Conidiobolus coronatus NRRL 28638]|uniref:Uncharacterized protein n=1 Tax=Conidiobolus coronatus (strain ATCC 28846 / CBS 209.66 / NRRL 28638) TaxID=796925 RepID=A0A137PAB3_CONC2|nr:hypothetical protein CONCODRAFT_5272 [Conidiobolus coronatus NRRL 28638]|eukprot:KXN71947.1 hypothetical protein CONCODRAFT_5272 [Conidiobolus coronatus NRRL 28638]